MGKIMIDQKILDELNSQYKNASPADIILKAFELNIKAVVTTNFRPYEVAILHDVSSVASKIPVVWCDTGYNTPQTYRHAEQVIKLRFKYLFICAKTNIGSPRCGFRNS